jgi:hypothetical protein
MFLTSCAAEERVGLGPSNVVEPPPAASRLRTDAAKRFNCCHRATAGNWKMLVAARTRFRRLNARNLLAKPLASVRFLDGIA